MNMDHSGRAQEHDRNGRLPEKPHLAGEVRCYFDVDGIPIEVALSTRSSRETIRANGRVVSEIHSFRLSRWHTFSIGGHDYKVLIATLSILRLEIFVQLYRDDRVVDSDIVKMLPVKANGRIDWLAAFRRFWPGILIGALVGFAIPKLFIS